MFNHLHLLFFPTRLTNMSRFVDRPSAGEQARFRSRLQQAELLFDPWIERLDQSLDQFPAAIDQLQKRQTEEIRVLSKRLQERRQVLDNLLLEWGEIDRFLELCQSHRDLCQSTI